MGKTSSTHVRYEKEYENFVEQFEGKRPIGKPGCRRKINLKT